MDSAARASVAGVAVGMAGGLGDRAASINQVSPTPNSTVDEPTGLPYVLCHGQPSHPGFIDGGNDNTESITNGVGFRNDISYGSIAPPVTYVLFVVFIVLMKAATVYAMRGLKQAK